MTLNKETCENMLGAARALMEMMTKDYGVNTNVAAQAVCKMIVAVAEGSTPRGVLPSLGSEPPSKEWYAQARKALTGEDE